MPSFKIPAFVIVFAAAFLLSSVAAYFSIVGLAAIFAATFWPVVIMGVALEMGKVVTTGWLHYNWQNRKTNPPFRYILASMVGALMLITSLGIYGFLSKGHLEQQAPLGGIELQVQQREQQIAALTSDNIRLQTRLDQLDKSIDVFLSNEKASQGLRARNTQQAERSTISTKMDSNYARIQELQTELIPYKQQTLAVEAKLGPIKYVAELFGWQDSEAAVRLVILIIMFAFDPLAIMLIIAGTISLSDYHERRSTISQTSETSTDLPPEPYQPTPITITDIEPIDVPLIEDEPVQEIIIPPEDSEFEVVYGPDEIESSDQEILEEVIDEIIEEMKSEDDNPNAITDKEQLFDLLDKNPEVLEQLIETVEARRTSDRLQLRDTKSKDE